jgi:prepilin-type N-terminal cleavage/methylation domain-containing protein
MKRINLLRSLRKRAAGNAQGFTLLEILVVLTIMGFLIAMVAPRLASVGGDAVDTVCDTNQNRMITYTATYLQQKNRLPSGLTNLISKEASDATIAQTDVAEVSDGDPSNGKGVLANEFGLRNNLKKHVLNSGEAGELQGLGIDKVYNLNDPENHDVDAPFMQEADIAAGLVVAMVGMGAESTTATIQRTATIDIEGADTAIYEHGMGEAEKLGRIVFGLGPECDLITDGVISNAAHCPGGLQNDDNCTYNDYNIVVPRLSSSVSRLATDLFGSKGISTTAVAYMDGDLDTDSNYNLVTNTSNLMIRTVTLPAQEIWEYATQCPEGHVYPESYDHWAIDLDGDDQIDSAAL